MARRGVIVRRLDAIENFGSMDVLCTDKTGTLTEGVVQLRRRPGYQGQPIDRGAAAGRTSTRASRRARQPAGRGDRGCGRRAPGRRHRRRRKMDEIPYDFMRKRLTSWSGETPMPSAGTSSSPRGRWRTSSPSARGCGAGCGRTAPRRRRAGRRSRSGSRSGARGLPRAGRGARAVTRRRPDYTTRRRGGHDLRRLPAVP